MSPSDSHDRIERAIDQMEIHSMICNYLRDVDERRFDRAPEYFTAEAVFQQYVSFEARDAQRPVSVATGHAEIVEQFHRFFRLLDRTHHSITNFVTDSHGDHADLSAHMRCYHRGKGVSDGLWEESLSLLQATVVRDGSGWRIRNFDYTVAIVLGYPAVFGDPVIAASTSDAVKGASASSLSASQPGAGVSLG